MVFLTKQQATGQLFINVLSSLQYGLPFAVAGFLTAPPVSGLDVLVEKSVAIIIQRITYSLAGQAIAVRVTSDPPDATNDGLFYLHSDHLGSASAMSDSSGSQVGATTRYTPFGSYRASGPNEITDRGFTGHRHNDDLGLIYMNARYYVKGIGRFASADTIVPDPMNPQSLNRYTYVLNSPLKYTDPTGHRDCEFDDHCGPPISSPPPIGEKMLGGLAGGKYDLTNWLAEEMVSNATGSDMLEIQELRAGNIFQQIAGLGPFYNLNTNNGRWNFKEETKGILESTMIVLCGIEQCRWFDYSTPGNIHYGFMAAAAGVRKTLSQIAAGALEAWDGNWYGLRPHWNEHPEDWAGVELGYLLYDAFGVDMTPLQLQIGLDMYWDQLQRPDSRLLKPADGIFPPETPYSLGAFDYE